MIKNLLFDFGDIFINLDKEAPFREMTRFGFTHLTPQLDSLAKNYEMGLLETPAFLSGMRAIFPKASEEQLILAWNAIILDFPAYRLEFIEGLKQENRYRLFLLSNTNALHIEKVKIAMGIKYYHRFQTCFEKFYLSHEIKMRKPNTAIYEFVLKENDLNAAETFFVDDTKENTDSAAALGIKVWHLQVGKQDIVQLQNQL